jgi:hypothetical protein
MSEQRDRDASMHLLLRSSMAAYEYYRELQRSRDPAVTAALRLRLDTERRHMDAIAAELFGPPKYRESAHVH